MQVKLETLFSLIENNDLSGVGDFLSENEELITAKREKSSEYDSEIELHAAAALGEDTAGMNCLQFAMNCYCDKEMIDFLLEEMPKDNIDDHWGQNNTALHLAAFLDDPRFVEALLETGADPLVKNDIGLTPMDIADKELKALFVVSKETEKLIVKPAETIVSAKPTDRRRSLNAFKERRTSVGVQALGTVKASFNEEDEIIRENREDIIDMFKNVPVYGRESYTKREYQMLVASAAEERELQDKIQRERAQAEASRKKFQNGSTCEEKSVVVVQPFHIPDNIDPLRDSSKVATIKSIQAERSPSKNSPIKSPMKKGKNTPRDSIDKFIQVIENRNPDVVSQFFRKIYLKVLEIRVSGTKADSEQYAVTKFGRNFQVSSRFKGSSLLNEEFVFKILGGSEDRVVIELRKARSKSGLKMLNTVFSGSPKKGADAPDYLKDDLLAEISISLSYLEKNCKDQVKKESFVWQSVNPGVTGIATLQLYLHADENYVNPKDMIECEKLGKLIHFERTEKIWGEGIIHISQNLLHWKRRYAKLQGGKMFTYEQEHRTPCEMIDFSGFEELSQMGVDECAIPLSFKVNTSRGHYYFYAENKGERAMWFEAILAMMTALSGCQEELEKSATGLDRNSSMKSQKSMKSIAASARF